jgi:hypothetical protein
MQAADSTSPTPSTGDSRSLPRLQVGGTLESGVCPPQQRRPTAAPCLRTPWWWRHCGGGTDDVRGPDRRLTSQDAPNGPRVRLRRPRRAGCRAGDVARCRAGASPPSSNVRRCGAGSTGSWSTAPRPAGYATRAPSHSTMTTDHRRPEAIPGPGQPVPRPLAQPAAGVADPGGARARRRDPQAPRRRPVRPPRPATDRGDPARRQRIRQRRGLRTPGDVPGQPAGSAAPRPGRRCVPQSRTT